MESFPVNTASSVERDMMTLEELRHRLGISASVAYELANRNDLPIPTIRVGRRFLFSRRAYDRLLSSGHDERDKTE